MRKFATIFALTWFGALASAQQVTVSVGSVTKYSGIATNERDVKDLKSLNEYLNILESQLAKEFVARGDIDYLDRMNTEAVFQELHLSDNSAFDASSGALRGLLGRLDFLVVIDSAESTTARVRLIDVESGAVRAIETCKRKPSFLGITQESVPDCIAPFVSRSREVAHAKMMTKTERLRQKEEQNRAAHQKAVAEQTALVKEQQKARAQAEVQAKEQAEANALVQARQAELDNQISALKPDLDDAVARLSSANDFWNKLNRQLASSGQSLRPSVRTALYSANADGKRCQEFMSQSNVDQVKKCISKLNNDLEKLDASK
jgi:hypothetical protein